MPGAVKLVKYNITIDVITKNCIIKGMNRSMNLLPQVSLSILVALSLKPRHGYEIMQQVEEDSHGAIRLAPGALYAAIKKLLDEKLIEEVDSSNERRRNYRITKKGLHRLQSEIEYLETTVALAKRRTAFGGSN